VRKKKPGRFGRDDKKEGGEEKNKELREVQPA